VSTQRLSADPPRVDSPFLNERLFVDECEESWQPHAAGLAASPFQSALEGPRDEFESGEVSGAQPLEERFDPSTIPQDVADALGKSDWSVALHLAIRGGWHDENELTNLLFFARHKELEPGPLDKKNSKFTRLSDEWGRILKTEVRPVIQKVSKDTNLKVTGVYVAERDPQLAGETGRKFKALVESVAADAGLNPGFLAAVLLAEWDRRSLYLSAGEVKSFVTGTDDFYASRVQLRAIVPVAFSKVRFDESRITTNINEHGRTVTTIPFRSGRDAALATAVYLKYAEIKLRKAFAKNGGDFDTLPVETRFALVRIAMAAGHGGISQDGDLIRFKKKDDHWVAVKKGEKGGALSGVASRVQRVLNQEDILVRKYEPRNDPTKSGHITNRNATILAAQSMHLSNWFFGLPLNTAAQPEFEVFDGFDDAEFRGNDETEDAEASYSDFDPEIAEEVTLPDDDTEGDDADDAIEARELDPVLADLAEKTIAREEPLAENQAPASWTTCFSVWDVARMQKVYEDNVAAASLNSVDRCSCIVMLNVALGRLLLLKLRQNRARGKSDRRVQMGDLTTDTIEKAMQQLRRRGYAVAPILVNFFDSRDHTAGTLKPVRLKASVQVSVLASSKKGCWSAFGLSIMDGYHSVLLLVDHTAADAKIYWLDQFSGGLDDDVTNSLDMRLTEKTQDWWQAIMDTPSKHKGYGTTVRLWQLRKPLKTS
jgi:hypothetical protein